MKYIGVHIDCGTSIEEAPAIAHSLGAEAFAFVFGDPGRYAVPKLSVFQAQNFRNHCARYGYDPARMVLPHSGFVVNLASPDERKLKLSRISFIEELERCTLLGIGMLNFHPGSHLKATDEDTALRTISESINYCLERTAGVTAVLENTAGQGTALGYSFSQLAEIIDRVEDKSRVGVCIDTCHAMAAGYDMSTPEGYERTWQEFDSTVGFSYLRAMHLNDAIRPAGSHIDRHAPIGGGTLGNDFFARLMEDNRIDAIPMILETPDTSLWTIEMEWLRSRQQQS